MPIGPPNRRSVIAGLLAVATGAVVATGTIASGGVPPSRLAALARGVNLPGWLDSEAGLAPAPQVLEALRAFGFRSVRLPVDGDLLLATGATGDGMLARVEAALDTLDRFGLAAMLDLHQLRNPADAEEVWRVLAGVVARSSPERVFPELLNEPPLAPETWIALRERLAAAIRERCPDHTLIWGAARHQGIWETVETPRLADANAVAAVHYYWPMGFTHQCQSWGDTALGRIGGLPFPARRDDATVLAIEQALSRRGDDEALAALDEEFASPWKAAQIVEDFASLARWSGSTGCPVIVNEFGVLDFCADSESRCRWIGAVREAAEAIGAGWTYWELDQGFGLMGSRHDPSTFDTGAMAALFGS